jgi:MFS family permease
MKIAFNSPKSQIIIIIGVTMLISMVSGIHRFLISLINNLVTNANTSNLYAYIDTPAPLILWLELAFTIAPFGLAKAITDYYTVSFREKKNVLQLAVFFYTGGVVIVIVLLALQRNFISPILLPIASGFIGAGEGFFYASAQILLSNYATGKNRGRFLGFSEFSIYGGYTFGSLVAGILSTGLNFALSYGTSLILLFCTLFLIRNLLLEQNTKKNKKSTKPEEIYSKNGETDSEPVKKVFNPMKMVKNYRILVVLVGSHLSKWGDALILLLPVYFAYLFSLDPEIIKPDTVKIGFILGVYTATWATGMFITSYLTEFLGRKTPIISGLILSGVGFYLLGTLGKTDVNLYYTSIFAMGLAGIGTGLYYPLLPAVGLDIAKPKYQGQTLALFRTFRDFGYFTGPIVLLFLVYMTGSSIKNLTLAITCTSILMVLIATFFLISLRETRPIWPFYNEFVMHSLMVQEIIKKSIHIFDKEMLEDIDGNNLNRAVKEAKSLERKADRKKRQLHKEIIVPLRKKDDLNEFISLVDMIDRIGNYSAMAGLKYSKLFHIYSRIPKPVLEALQNLAQGIPPMMDELLQSINLLNEKVSLTVKHQKILSIAEKRVDLLYDDFLHLLYQFEPFYIETEKFTIMMTLKESSELLEKASDLILTVGDNLSMIALRHRL